MYRPPSFVTLLNNIALYFLATAYTCFHVCTVVCVRCSNSRCFRSTCSTLCECREGATWSAVNIAPKPPPSLELIKAALIASKNFPTGATGGVITSCFCFFAVGLLTLSGELRHFIIVRECCFWSYLPLPFNGSHLFCSQRDFLRTHPVFLVNDQRIGRSLLQTDTKTPRRAWVGLVESVCRESL